MQIYLIKQFMCYLNDYRDKTVFNLPTLEFLRYMAHRTVYQDESLFGFYENNMQMMSIDLIMFFPYKEDLIDLIECLRLTTELFKSKDVSAFDEDTLWWGDKF
jgi:hypothetical protein